MKLEIDVDHLVVVSDLHLGNPFSSAPSRIVEFLDHLESEGIDLCINGDGLDIAQATTQSLADHTTRVVARIERFRAAGRRVYYVAGNHDEAMLHFIGDWIVDAVAPFLNLTNSRRRIRIEHGHVYDPLYTKSPALYNGLCRAGRPLARLLPDVYSFISSVEGRLSGGHTDGADSPCATGAAMLLARGFDAVVMGHTHHAMLLELGDGVYVNSGNWMNDTTYVEILPNEIRLQRWEPDGIELLSRVEL
jgi:UDP-2,3-diacylglucosamine pyrophosphatase LpxH